MNKYKALLGVAMLLAPAFAMAQANISNGNIRIGVRADGALMPNLESGTTGITYLATGNDALTPGCLCEAWGIADAISATSGYTGADVGTVGITNLSFVSTATTATSVVDALGKFEVTHSFSPSAATLGLYEVRVTIKNTSAASTRVLYGRAMDWDVGPTEFAELVTMQRGNSANLIYSSDDGFFTADPLANDVPDLFFNQNVVDSGPADHGAHFRFDFGNLAPGASVEFTIGYGAENSTAAALASLTAFGAESYSLGEPSSSTDGTPNTFMFAFKGTGGTPIIGGTCAGQGYKGAKLTWCKNICENGLTGQVLDTWIHRWITRYRVLPYCAVEGGGDTPT